MPRRTYPVRSRGLLLPVLLAALALTVPVRAQSGLAERIQAYLDSVQTSGSYPGLTVGVALADGTTLALASGLADREAGTAMRPRDRMMTGSVGKMFFAALALQLIGEGVFGLDDPVARHLGDLSWYPRLPNAEAITVRTLLNHTSGLVRYEFDDRFLRDLTADPYRVWRPEELVAYLLDSPAPFPAGQGWTYSDTNYIVLGILMERLTGRTVYEQVRTRFLGPLGLADTIPSDRPVLPGLVQGYAGANNPFGGRDAMIEGGRFTLNPQFEWTGGGYITSSWDLSRWARELFTGKVYGPETLARAVEGVSAPGLGRGARYGLGIILWSTRLGPAWGHSGYFPGYLTEVRWYPDLGVAVAVQVNTSAARSPGSIADGVAARISAGR